jgi:putative ABC transport system substrate-binding protein
MRRREFIALVGGAAAWPVVARAQQTAMPVIGFLYQGASVDAVALRSRFAAFQQGLRDAGFIEGKNLAIEYRGAERAEQLTSLAAELVRLNVRLIVAVGSEASHASQRSTRSIPIVMSSSSDPVGTGLIASLARPGGNITGMSLASPDLAGKRLELLREMVGDISVVAALWSSGDPPAALSLRETETSAQKLLIKLIPAGVRAPTDFGEAFELAMKAHPKGLVIIPAPMMNLYPGQIAALATKNELPAISYAADFPRAGGLVSYGPSIIDSWGRSAAYVGKILNGTKPADLPVEQPSKFELVINLKTAKSLRLDVPLQLQQWARQPQRGHRSRSAILASGKSRPRVHTSVSRSRYFW